MEHRLVASGLLHTTFRWVRLGNDPTPAWSALEAILCDSRGMN
jgi:hypothetical protein